MVGIRKSARFILALTSLVLVATVAMAGCGSSSSSETPLPGGQVSSQAGLLNGAGATFPYPLYSKWFDQYSKIDTGVRFNYQSIGSGGGIKQITEKTVDFGASDAPMTDAQLKAAPGELLHIPTVLGAVAVTYNLPDVSGGLQLTPDSLAGIFLGDITKWNDPQIAKDNGSVTLPNQDILVIHRSDGSGTTNIFTDYLTAVSETWKSKVGKGTAVNWPAGVGGKGNEGVAGQVKQTPGAIGYVELAYAVQNKLTYAALKNQSGSFVQPTLDSVTAAAAGAASQMPEDLRVSIVNAPGEKAYPISGYTYILIYKEQQNQAKGVALTRFLWWATHDGQGSAKDLLYAPLPTEVVAKVEAKIKSINYQGKPVYPGT